MSADHEDEEEYEEIEDDEEVVDDASEPAGSSRLKMAVIGLIAVIVVTNLVTAIILWRLSKSSDQKPQAASTKSAEGASLSKGARNALVMPPPERPKTSDVAVAPKVVEPPEVEPPKEEPPKIAVRPPEKKDVPQKPTPPPEKPTTKVVVAPPPKGAAPAGPVELLAFESFAGKPQDHLPSAEKADHLEFEVGAFDAVLGPPAMLSRLLRIERSQQGFTVKHSARSGLGNVPLLECEMDAQAGRAVWKPSPESGKSYAACFRSFVLALADRKGNALHWCRPRRDEVTKELTLSYTTSGSIGGAEDERAWSFAYPWPEALRVQHGDLGGVAPVPLAPTAAGGPAAPRVYIRTTPGTSRSLDLVFRRAIEFKGQKLPLEMILRFAPSADVDADVDAEGARKVTVTACATGLAEFLAGAVAPEAELKRDEDALAQKKQALEKAGEELRRAEADYKRVSSRYSSAYEDYSPISSTPSEKRELGNLKAQKERGANLVRKCEQVVKGLKGNVEELDARMTDRERAAEAVKGNVELPEEESKKLDAVALLDPWGVPLARLMLRLKHAEAERGPAAPAREPRHGGLP